MLHRACVVALYGLAALSCRDRARDDAELTADAESAARRTTLTGGSLPGATRDAARDETLEAVRAEQVEARGRLATEIDRIDAQLAAVRTDLERDAAGVSPAARRTAATREEREAARKLLQRRELLEGDMNAIERSTAQDWPTLRAKLDRDLGAPGREGGT